MVVAISHKIKSETYKNQNDKFRIFRQFQKIFVFCSLNNSHYLLNDILSHCSLRLRADHWMAGLF
jgi:hypothetical protein